MRSSRSGFTLIEVIVAMVIVAGVVLSVGAATTSMFRASIRSQRQAQAAAAAEAQLSLIQVWPEYPTLDSAFSGVTTDTPLPGWTRTVQVVQEGRAPNSYKRITVTISGVGLDAPVSRSTTMAEDLL